jgi:uncharacterized protein with von Willebrand factor type A (vWA) domain
LPLGIDDYKTLLHALQAGFGLEDRDAIVRLCSVLWAKSQNDIELIHYHFVQVMKSDDPTESSLEKLEEHSGKPSDEQIVTPSGSEGTHSHDKTETQNAGESLGKKPVQDKNDGINSADTQRFVLDVEDEVQVVQAMQTTGWEDEIITNRFLLTSDYLPMTRRQMKRSWRYLRRMVREGPSIELDIEATVAIVGRQGMLVDPVLVPRRINRTELLLLLDQNGSMVPFQMLSRRLSETALRGGHLGKTNIYYFHNCPVDYVYRNPYLLDSISIEDVVKQFQYRHVRVLIFSDAGAARGGFNDERVELTFDFADRLKPFIQYIAWLNPMPRSRWAGTTAAEIAKIFPMFEISRRGMDEAVRALMGRSTRAKGSE